MPGICTNRCDITTLEAHTRPRFVPGEPAESELYLRTASEFAEDRIPPYNAGIDLRYPCRLSPHFATLPRSVAWNEAIEHVKQVIHHIVALRTGRSSRHGTMARDGTDASPGGLCLV